MSISHKKWTVDVSKKLYIRLSFPYAFPARILFKTETKIDPDLRFGLSRNSPQSMKPFTALVV